MRADIEIGHRFCATAGGVQRKSAAKTECVENRPAAGQTLDLAPILPLIEKEPGFLAANDIRFKTKSGFEKNDREVHRRPMDDLAIGGVKILCNDALYITAEAQDDALGMQLLFEQIDNRLDPGHPRAGVKLDHKTVGVPVHNQPGPAVAFSIDPPEAGCVLIE